MTLEPANVELKVTLRSLDYADEVIQIHHYRGDSAKAKILLRVCLEWLEEVEKMKRRDSP